ncbi:hypothetical protein ACH5RR_019052 [Cinchona calisaya]|uniref:Germin-like protein n=1 Tax=Cinchona calisaya TaxID=153742 RepID=A0ABD2ZNR4_9GENT
MTAFTLVASSDPDILSDFVVPGNNAPVDGNFFTYTGFRGVLYHLPPDFTATEASVTEFRALDGQSVSLDVLQFPGGSVNPPHTRPRASGLLIVVTGQLEVGFIDTKNVLYNQTLVAGDMFIFPKGLVHYQYNPFSVPAIAIAAFGSASPGTVSVPKTVFTTGIDDNILAKAFKTDAATIENIKAGFTEP